MIDDELVKGSGISPDVVQAAGIYLEHEAKAAAKLLGRAPKYWEGHLPVMVIPYHLPGERDPVLYRGKPAVPFEGKGKDGSETRAVKYVAPSGSGVHVYYPPGMLSDSELRASPRVPLILTEGEKKTLSADSHGFAAIGFGGVTMWHRKGERAVHPQLTSHVNLDGRQVYICFDRDALSNAAVRKQEQLLGEALCRLGARPAVVRFPEEAPKLDDFLVAEGAKGLRRLMDDARKRGRITPPPEIGAPEEGQALSDLGNAERFVQQHGDDLLFCHGVEIWYVWDGKRWAPDVDGEVMRRAGRTVRSIYSEAKGAGEDGARRIESHAKRSESHGAQRAMVALASTFRAVAVTTDAFDASPWLISCRNGTVDLRTGELREHRREDLVSKLAPVDYDPHATHPRWSQFVQGISDDDAELERFFQTVAGYSATGDTSEDKVILLYGKGGRGKSTFVVAIESALGDYGRTADISAFLKDKHAGGDKPRPDLVRLRGARLVACKEVEQGAKLAEATVKTVTGGDVIAVRGLRQDYVEFRPTFKLWIVANDAPFARSDDTGMWRRILRVPFDRPVPNPDPELRAAFLHDESIRSAVFAWMVRGARMWLDTGLVVPDRIQRSTQRYREENDPFLEFFRDYTVVEEGAKVARHELRREYEQWCEREGQKPLHAKAFASGVRSHVEGRGVPCGNSTVRDYQGVPTRAWKGIRLLSELERMEVEGDEKDGGDSQDGGVSHGTTPHNGQNGASAVVSSHAKTPGSLLPPCDRARAREIENTCLRVTTDYNADKAFPAHSSESSSTLESRPGHSEAPPTGQPELGGGGGPGEDSHGAPEIERGGPQEAPEDDGPGGGGFWL